MTQTNNERELIEQLAKDSGAESSTWRNGITYHYFTTEQLEAFAKAYQSQNERQEDIGDGKYAIYFQDNWDGEADKYWTFAFKENGIWKSSETHNDLFQYEGDEILKIVPLYNQLELASPPKQAIPEGWRLVPIEPTKTMLNFMSANWGTSKNHAGSLEFARETYKAMLNAAPTNTEVGE